MLDEALAIVKINIDIDKSDLRRTVEHFIDEHFSSYDVDFDIRNNTLKSGKSVCVVAIKDNDSQEEIQFVVKDEVKNYKIEPLKLSNMNDSFYEVTIDYGYNHFSVENLNEIFTDLAKKGKGTYASLCGDAATLIVDGHKRKIKTVGIIDENNILYSSNEESNEMTDIDDDISYIPKYTIDEWLIENATFKGNLDGLGQNEKLQLMAQFAIYQKNNDLINGTQFRDLMIQLGNIADLLGGFTDETVKSVYKLIV